MEFRWNDWNLDHIGEHGVRPEECEYVVENSEIYQKIRDEHGLRYVVRGQAEHGRYLQVIFIFSPEDVAYVIHARPLDEREKRNYRRGRK